MPEHIIIGDWTQTLEESNQLQGQVSVTHADYVYAGLPGPGKNVHLA